MKREIVGSASEWFGVLGDMYRQFDDGSLTLKHMIEMVSYHRNPFEDLAYRINSQVGRQRIIYKNVFPKSVLDGFNLDFGKIQISHFTPEFNRVIVIAGGFVSNNLAFEACLRRFPCWRWTEDLDKVFTENDRDASNYGYAVLFRDRQEADEELKNLSANQLKEKGILGPTLLERQWHEIVYYDETGEHLDLKNWTLCSGSRSSDGIVPCVSWHDDELAVSWHYPLGRHDRLRSRVAVPCLPKAN